MYLLTCRSKQFVILKAFITLFSCGYVDGEWEVCFYLYMFIMIHCLLDFLLFFGFYKFCVKSKTLMKRIIPVSGVNGCAC